MTCFLLTTNFVTRHSYTPVSLYPDCKNTRHASFITAGTRTLPRFGFCSPACILSATQTPHIAGPLGLTRSRIDNPNKKNSYLWFMNIIDKNIDSLIILCKQHKVRELYLFGSILTPRFNRESDIDLLVQFDNVDILEYADNYFDFKEKLEKLLGREVDLLENQAIRNPIFRKILDRDKKIVYDRETA